VHIQSVLSMAVFIRDYMIMSTVSMNRGLTH